MSAPLRRPDGVRLVSVAVAAAFVVAGALAVARWSGLDVEQAVSDPQEFTGYRFLGVLSTLGVLVWTAAASVCLLAAMVSHDAVEDRRLHRFFVASTAVTLLLLVDDLFLVHEFADDTLGFFIEFEHSRGQKDALEMLVFSLYGAIFLLYARRFRDVLLGSRHRWLLAAALVSFAISVVIDAGLLVLLAFDPTLDIFLEEAPKFLGIAYWATFYFSVAHSSLRREPLPAARARTPR